MTKFFSEKIFMKKKVKKRLHFGGGLNTVKISPVAGKMRGGKNNASRLYGRKKPPRFPEKKRTVQINLK